MSLYTKDTIFKVSSTENISFTGTAANGTAVSATAMVAVVRVVATQDCWIKIGKSATATTSDTFLPANVVEYLQIHTGERVSAIQNSASGTLNTSFMSH